jgi:hypothetical protein
VFKHIDGLQDRVDIANLRVGGLAVVNDIGTIQRQRFKPIRINDGLFRAITLSVLIFVQPRNNPEQ